MMTATVFTMAVVVLLTASARAAAYEVSLAGSDWWACRAPPSADAAAVDKAGVALSLSSSTTNFSKKHCVPATVPGTAFVALLANGTFPNVTDPFLDDDLATVPDINVTGRDYWRFFYVKWLPRSGGGDGGGTAAATLQLRSVSYRAQVWFRGRAVTEAGTGLASVAGMWRRFHYPLDVAGGALAILVEPPDHIGVAKASCAKVKPAPKAPPTPFWPCGQGGDHALAQDGPVSQCAAGWDWVQGTPDRNTGPWDAVTLRVSGPARLTDAVVTADDIVVGDAGAHPTASLTFNVTLVRNPGGSGGGGPLRGTVRVAVPALGVALQAPVAVPAPAAAGTPAASVTVSLGPVAVGAAAGLKLWWPHTLGAPQLYNATFEALFPASDNDGASRLSDAAAVRFGVRNVTSWVDKGLGGRVFAVNGVKLFLQGGNWIFPDQFRRFAGNASRSYAEVRLHQQMGFNLIRVWGGGGAERPEFFAACDALGVFVMQEFWMSGDNNGRWAGSYDWPLDPALYLAAARDTVLLLRPHPSLLFWNAGNELYPTPREPAPQPKRPGCGAPGACTSPPRAIADGLPALVAALDPGRLFVVSSMTNATTFDPETSLAPRDGPYTFMDERKCFNRNPNMVYWNATAKKVVPATKLPIAFQPELGSASLPPYRSLQRFLRAGPLAAFPGWNANGTSAAPRVHPAWAWHTWLGFGDGEGVDHVFNYGGAPNSTREYAWRAQLAQARQYQSLFEGFRAHMPVMILQSTFCRLKARRCTAMAWIFIPVYCFTLP